MTVATPTAPSAERKTYRAGGGRRIAFTFIFLLLLPFYVSLPAMLYQRVANGLWADTIGLFVIALGFTALMGLILAEMLLSIRTRVDIGEKAVRLTVPATSGPTPKLSYKSHDVPYDQIEAIETRREIYGGSMAPVKYLGARIMMKGGKIIPLGFVSEADTDPVFPYPDIAKELSQRSGAPLRDQGSVYRSYGRRLLGLATIPGQDQPITETQIEALNKRHYNLVLALVLFLVLLVGTGILLDVLGA